MKFIKIILFNVLILLILSINTTKSFAQNNSNQLMDSIVYYIDSLIKAQQELIRIKQEEYHEKRVKILKADNNTTSVDLTYEYRIAKLDKKTPIQLDYNEQIKRYIDIYTGSRAEEFGKLLGLSQYYFPLFEEQLAKYGLPLEFKYLPIIESSLNPLAVSSSGATGLWQFKFTSSQMFDLEVNSYVDERCDPYKSTVAACKYLQYLYRTFNDWQLVLAAYNGGPGEVRNAIARSNGETGFWKIQPYLPEQTKNYVPAFIAAAYLMNYADDHNIKLIKPMYKYSETDTVMICPQISFEQVSQISSIPVDALKFLNPSYKLGYIPESEGQYVLVIPSQYITNYLQAEQQLKTLAINNEQAGKNRIGITNNYSKTEKPIKIIHVVQKGEYVHKIAMKYGCSIEEIKTWNDLNDMAINPGQLLEVYIKPESEFLINNADLTILNNPGSEISEGYLYYIVQKGDTLYGIAQKLGLSNATQIIEMNNIDNATKIEPGRFLKVSKI